MADSVGGPTLPRTGIQEGHLHFDKESNILWVYNGGLASNPANWSVVSPVSSSGSSGSIGFQRWPWHWKGTELSSAFGAGGFSIFVAPAAGTITKWATLVGGVGLPEDTNMQFYDDVLNTFILIDSFTLPTGTNNAKSERTLSLSVASGRVIGVLTANSYAPTAHTVTLDGYVDFTPN